MATGLLRFVEESEETVAKDLEASGFETYKPYERQTSVTSTAFTENQESGIVANLADLNKLLGHCGKIILHVF